MLPARRGITRRLRRKQGGGRFDSAAPSPYMKGMEPNVALADSIMADALMLKEDTGLGIVTMVPEFHFNTKLAHILTGWYRLAQKGLAVEEAYAEWKGLAAEFVAGLPVVSRVNSQTGELMDPLRAARAAYPAPETPPQSV
jgi:hypothetical protein